MKGIAEKADLRIVEVPIQFSERTLRSSKLVPFREITAILPFLGSPTKERTAHTWAIKSISRSTALGRDAT